MHEDMDAVVAGKRAEPEIGDDEQLRRQRLELVFDRAGGLRHHDVDAGRERADRLLDRERGGHFGIEGLLDRELAFPDRDAALAAKRSSS